jgi:chromosomal replication initiation ATPase DnaA
MGLAGGVLAPPDDALMEAVLIKLFADRQLEVAPAVVRYLALHLERSFAAMRNAVTRLDRLAIEERRRVTRPLAARMVSEMARSRD